MRTRRLVATATAGLVVLTGCRDGSAGSADSAATQPTGGAGTSTTSAEPPESTTTALVEPARTDPGGPPDRSDETSSATGDSPPAPDDTPAPSDGPSDGEAPDDTAPGDTAPADTPPNTTLPDTTLPGDVVDLADPDTVADLEPDTEHVIGQSVEGRPITVVRRGTPGGTRVLVVGVIHGDEDAGVGIVDVLRLADVPAGVELWLVRSMNPDGQAARQRHNANGVDLNRNFGHNWGPVAEPGNWEYSGPGPASEPETQVMTRLGEAIQPDLVLWYHQDLFRISPSTGRDGEIRSRYAALTGLPLVRVTGGTYTGTASQWSRTVLDDAGVGFTVELGATLSSESAITHADAVLTVAAEM